MSIRTEMPLLARHEGDWLGTYILIDIRGNIIDQHKSHLTCQFPEDGSHDYYQINRYIWDDDKKEEIHFPGTYKDQKLWFDMERIKGYAWEIDPMTIILTWTYKIIPDQYLYEMIQLSPCGNYRSRTWHWFKNNKVYQRTLIQEERMQSQ